MRMRRYAAVFLRDSVCLILIGILPVSLLADDTQAAILHNNGGVLVNGNAALNTATIFPGDTVVVQARSVARIEVPGTAVDINTETILVFDGDEVHLEHGSVSVNTSHGFRVRTGCVMVVPVNAAALTHYEVVDTDSKVHVTAVKNEATIEALGKPIPAKQSSSSRITVREGEQKSHDEKCGNPNFKQTTHAFGPWLNSPWVYVPSAILITGGTLCLLLCFHNLPISPSMPSNSQNPKNPNNPNGP